MHVIDSYVHNERIGVLVELSAESAYAIRTDEFKTLGWSDQPTFVASVHS